MDSSLLARNIEHLKQLNHEGKLMVAGPFKNNEQAMIILNCEDVDEAIKLVERDPFIKDKYYYPYDINDLIVANEENNWLMESPQTAGKSVH